MSCPGCGVAVAADQRYCLACGARLGAPLTVRLGLPAAMDSAPRAGGRGLALRLPSPRVAATLVLMLLGFGAAIGAAAGPPAGARVAARPDLRIELPPAPPPPVTASPAPPPAPEAPAPSATPSGPSEPASSPGEPSSAPSEPAASTTPAPTESESGDDDAATTTPAPKPKAPPLKHVWLVALDEQPGKATFGDPVAMPYLAKDLRDRGELLSHFHPAGASALSSGIGLLDGATASPEQDQNCPTYTDATCVLSTESFTILDQLAANGGTWKAYAESIPAPCAHPELGAPDPPGPAFWTARVAPLYFHSVIDAPDCAQHVVGLDALAGDLEDPPSLSLVVPDLTHDGHADLAAADGWLKQTLEPILDSKAYKDGGLVVVTADHTPDGSPAGALLLSQYVKAGAEVKQPYDGFALLRALQDAFGLRHLGETADEHRPRFGASVWSGWSQDLHASDTGS